MNSLIPATEPVVWNAQDPQHQPVSEWLAWLVVGTLHNIIPPPDQESGDE